MKDPQWRYQFTHYLKELILNNDTIDLDEQTKESTKKISTALIEAEKENSAHVDKHIVYIAGGGLIIASQILLSEKIGIVLRQDMYLALFAFSLAFCFFAFSLIALIAAYNCNTFVHYSSAIATNYFNDFYTNIFLLSKNITEQGHMQNFEKAINAGQSYTAAESLPAYIESKKLWDRIRKNMLLVEKLGFWGRITTLLSYLCFSVAMIMFVSFALLLIREIS
jgi:hypothetical protein